MKDYDMHLENVTVEYISKLFRCLNEQELQSITVCSELYKILSKNLVISDEILMKRLKLSLYNPHHKLVHCYYIRSWKFSAEDFETILNDFTLDGTYGSIIEFWCAQLKSETPLESVYIRYVGQSANPQKRTFSDNVSRKNGFMSNFFKKAQSLGIKALSYNTMTFEQESITITRKQRGMFRNESTDIYGQVVFNLFGLNCLLNSQPGGFNQKFSPSEQDRQGYLVLKPKFFTKLKQYLIPYSTTTNPTNNPTSYQDAQNQMEPWINSIKQIHQQIDPALRHDSLIQYVPQEFYLNSIRQLATPIGSIYGHHLIVMLSDDITEGAFHSGEQILDSDSSRASYVLCDMLSRLEAWERNRQHWNPIDTKNFKGYFPFINIVPWLENSKLTFSQGLLQTRIYLQTVQPIITVSFSRNATSGAFSNFIHRWGLESKIDMIDVIGIPRIVSYAEDHYLHDDSDSGPPPGYSTIVVPHFQPGLDKYTMRLSNGPRKLMDITWQVTLCIAEIAMDIIKKYQFEDREVIIAKIMSKVSKGSANIPTKLEHLYTKLGHFIEDYKEKELACKSEYPKSTLSREENQERALLGAMTRLLQFENTIGEPGSLERQKQSNRLWKMNMPVYHISISRNYKDEWFQWVNSMPKDKNIHMSSMQLKSKQCKRKHENKITFVTKLVSYMLFSVSI